VWGDEQIQHQRGKVGDHSTLDGGPQSGGDGRVQETSQGQFCQLCNAWRGNLGLEPTPQLFVDHIVEVMRGVWRVLRDDGVLWLNLGSSYASHDLGGYRAGEFLNPGGKQPKKQGKHRNRAGTPCPAGFKPKDLISIPWMVALALQADGWYLRSAMPWIKKNPMPESVRDRPTNAHEFVFLLSKSKRYFYDGEAVKMPHCPDGRKKTSVKGGPGSIQHRDGERWPGTGRNRRTSDTFRESLALRIAQQRQYLAHLEHVQANGGMMVDEDGGPVALLVNTSGFSGSHFAVFPTKLIQPLIAAGSSEYGCCSSCGSPWERVVEKEGLTTTEKRKMIGSSPKRGDGGKLVTQNLDYAGGHGSNIRESKTTGWRPTCKCNADVVPCVVFDPFGGSGTTALQADRMGRNAVIIELNETYATKLSYQRIAGDAPMFADVEIVT
jgi:hypothetical protein